MGSPGAIISAGGIIDRAIASMGAMATLPEVSAKIVALVNSPTGSALQLQAVIRHDPALSALVLKAVNSAFYGFPGQIVSLDRAILLLGFAAVRNIALSSSLSRVFGEGADAGPLPPRALWQHSLAVGLAAKALASFQRRDADPDEMFLIGLLHDLGLVVEQQAFPDELAEVVARRGAEQVGLLELEAGIVGVNHQELGEALMAKWRFPRSLRKIASHHHDPESLPEEYGRRGSMLRVADLLAGELGIGTGLADDVAEISAELRAASGVLVEQLAEVKDRLPDAVAEAMAVFGGEER